ncbi:Thoeris anti-defense Tad2 family protein [Xenorhabdus budapestensis]|uniref:Thoeris anti-defense Tad2 family protein n=1 Tax=Xenorhabdus budapestensis TaxID=290110 RepID=UPI003A8A32DA
MSEVNKLDLNCPFNPDQYNIGDGNITVPAGTSAWALSLVYLGEQVHRSGWNAPIEHMRLAHKSETDSGGDGTAYVEKSDKDGYWSRWTPTQEDLLACDWKLLKSVSECPEDSVLVFDLTPGVKVDDLGETSWGHEYYGVDGHFGPLNIIQNKTDIAKISIFYWIEYGKNSLLSPNLFWNVTPYPNSESPQKVVELFGRTLYITVDNVSYNLGEGENASSYEDGDSNYCVVSYKGAEAQKFSEILKQTGTTKRFCFKWV